MCSYNGLFGYVQFQKTTLSVQRSTVYLGMFSLGILTCNFSFECLFGYVQIQSSLKCELFNCLLEHV